MNTNTETIIVTGLSAEVLRRIDERAAAAGLPVGEYVRDLIERKHAELLSWERKEPQKVKDAID